MTNDDDRFPPAGFCEHLRHLQLEAQDHQLLKSDCCILQDELRMRMETGPDPIRQAAKG